MIVSFESSSLTIITSSDPPFLPFSFKLKILTHLRFGRFEKKLAAEALRRNENDFQKALDDLTNPETNSAIQVDCFCMRFS